MATHFLKRAEALRAEAWEAVQSSPAYAAFKAMDDAVVAIGGRSVLARDDIRSAASAEMREAMRQHAAEIAMPMRRISHAQAATSALRKIGRPLQAASLMEAARQMGANIGGEKPLTNFTSSLSKDDRLLSFRKDGSYFWWFAEEPLPANWNEAEPNEFDDILGSASSSPSERGGDGHGPATT